MVLWEFCKLLKSVSLLCNIFERVKPVKSYVWFMRLAKKNICLVRELSLSEALVWLLCLAVKIICLVPELGLVKKLCSILRLSWYKISFLDWELGNVKSYLRL